MQKLSNGLLRDDELAEVAARVRFADHYQRLYARPLQAGEKRSLQNTVTDIEFDMAVFVTTPNSRCRHAH